MKHKVYTIGGANTCLLSRIAAGVPHDLKNIKNESIKSLVSVGGRRKADDKISTNFGQNVISTDIRKTSSNYNNIECDNGCHYLTKRQQRCNRTYRERLGVRNQRSGVLLLVISNKHVNCSTLEMGCAA
jgi:hypothetical protein